MKKGDIDLPVCLLTIAAFEGLKLVNRPFALGMAVATVFGLTVFLWWAGKRGSE